MSGTTHGDNRHPTCGEEGWLPWHQTSDQHQKTQLVNRIGPHMAGENTDLRSGKSYLVVATIYES